MADENGTNEKEQSIVVEDPAKALVNFLANFHKDMNTRVDSADTLKMLMRWRILESKGIRLAGKAADIFEKLMWSTGGGKAREEAVEVLKRVPKESGRIEMTGPVPESETE